MNAITRDFLHQFRPEIQAALDSIAKKHGLAASVGNIRFGPDRFSVKIEMATTSDPNNVGEKKEKQDYIRAAAMYGLDPAWLDKSFSMANKSYTIKGLYPNKRKNNVLVECNGKSYIMPPSTVAAYMNKSVPVPASPLTGENGLKILTDITNLLQRVDNLGEIQPGMDWDKRRKEEDEIYAEMDRINSSVTGLQVGRVLQFPVADGYAWYIITNVGAHTVTVEHIPLSDAYQYGGVYKTASGKLQVHVSVAERYFYKKLF